jgi:hypothetical protein
MDMNDEWGATTAKRVRKKRVIELPGEDDPSQEARDEKAERVRVKKCQTRKRRLAEESGQEPPRKKRRTEE